MDTGGEAGHRPPEGSGRTCPTLDLGFSSVCLARASCPDLCLRRGGAHPSAWVTRSVSVDPGLPRMTQSGPGFRSLGSHLGSDPEPRSAPTHRPGLRQGPWAPAWVLPRMLPPPPAGCWFAAARGSHRVGQCMMGGSLLPGLSCREESLAAGLLALSEE